MAGGRRNSKVLSQEREVRLNIGEERNPSLLERQANLRSAPIGQRSNNDGLRPSISEQARVNAPPLSQRLLDPGDLGGGAGAGLAFSLAVERDQPFAGIG